MVCVSVPTAAVAADGLADAGAVAGADALGTAAAGTAGTAIDLSGTAAALQSLGMSASEAAATADSAATLGGGALGAGGAGAAANVAGGGGGYLSSLINGMQAGMSGASDSVPAFTDIGGDSAIGGTGATSAGGAAVDGFGNPIVTGDAGTLLNGAVNPAVDSSGVSQVANAASGAGGSGGSNSSILDSLGKYASKQNPLNMALAGGSVLSGIQSLIPRKQVNTGQNAASVLATNPSFSNPNLPQYSMQNTAQPYTGNWYTYGQSPQTPLYNAQPIPVNNANAAKRGGLIKNYAHGGMVRHYAMGGPVPGQAPMGMPAPPTAPLPMPPQGMGAPPPRPPMQQKPPVNPLAMQMAAHKIGMVIGKHMKQRGMTPDGRVKGPGGGQDDIVPARLSKDEFVIPADVTAALGDGSSEAGGKKLEGLMDNVRKHKTGTTKYPPKAKNPLAYIPKGKS